MNEPTIIEIESGTIDEQFNHYNNLMFYTNQGIVTIGTDNNRIRIEPGTELFYSIIGFCKKKIAELNDLRIIDPAESIEAECSILIGNGNKLKHSLNKGT